MSCRLDLPPQTLSLSPSIPHPLSKKSDIKQGRGRWHHRTQVCSNIIHTRMRMQPP